MQGSGPSLNQKFSFNLPITINNNIITFSAQYRAFFFSEKLAISNKTNTTLTIHRFINDGANIPTYSIYFIAIGY